MPTFESTEAPVCKCSKDTALRSTIWRPRSRGSDESEIRERLAWCCDAHSGELASDPKTNRDAKAALRLARRAIELMPGEASYFRTLGVLEYRERRYAESIATLARSLEAGRGQDESVDLYFMAMAHQRLGYPEKARDCYERANRSLEGRKGLSPARASRLSAFRAEAKAALAEPAGELPGEVFAKPR